MNPIKNILRQSVRPPSYTMNVLGFVTHERLANSLASCNINFCLFWSSKNKFFKKWEYEYADLPKNVMLLPEVYDSVEVPPYIDVDVLLSQSRFGQFQSFNPISNAGRIPFVHLEHTLPDPKWTRGQFLDMVSMRAQHNVYITEFQCREWRDDSNRPDVSIIQNGIDTNFFCPNDNIKKEGHVLSIANDFQNRNVFCGHNIWAEVTGYHSKLSFPTKIYGATKGLSKPTRNTEHLLDVYRKANVFLDTSFCSTCPTTIIEASSVGLPIVCTEECGKPEFLVEHEKTGFCTNSPAKMKEYCLLLLNDEELARKIGEAGGEKMVREFNQEDYARNIEEILRKVAG